MRFDKIREESVRRILKLNNILRKDGFVIVSNAQERELEKELEKYDMLQELRFSQVERRC